MKLLKIQSVIPSNKKINVIWFDGNEQESLQFFDWLKKRQILSIEEVDVVLEKHEFINKSTRCLDSKRNYDQNPNEDEDYVIRSSDVAEMEEDFEQAEFLRAIGE